MRGVNNKPVRGANNHSKLVGANRLSSRGDGMHRVLLSNPLLLGVRRTMLSNSSQVAGVSQHKEHPLLLNNLPGERRILHNSNQRQILGGVPPPNLLIP